LIKLLAYGAPMLKSRDSLSCRPGPRLGRIRTSTPKILSLPATTPRPYWAFHVLVHLATNMRFRSVGACVRPST